MTMIDTPTDRPRFVRADGPDKVTGSGRYVADLTLSGQLHAKFRYADVPHARIVRIDTTAAKALPGVFAVLTADDVPDVRYGPGLSDRTLFARDVVRYEGEVIAAVAAMTPEIAQAAVEAVEVELEEMPVVTDLELALTAGSPLVHPEWQSYESDAERDGNVASFSSIEHGDAATAMAGAHTVVSSRYVADGCHAAPIEPRGVLAQWEGNKVTIWTSTQVPFDARAGVCQTLQLPTNRVRVIVPHLGGGFGGKCGFHYEAHVAALARVAKRPVRLVFSRREEFLAPDRRREGMIIDVTSGLDSDGRIVSRTGSVLIDNGAYTADAVFFPQLAAMHVAGPYRVPNLAVEARIIYTNHQPSGSAGLLGARVPHRRTRRSNRHGSCAVPASKRPRQRSDRRDRSGVRRHRTARLYRGCDESCWVRRRASHRRGHRCGNWMVAELSRPVGRLHQDR